MRRMHPTRDRPQIGRSQSRILKQASVILFHPFDDALHILFPSLHLHPINRTRRRQIRTS